MEFCKHDTVQMFFLNINTKLNMSIIQRFPFLKTAHDVEFSISHFVSIRKRNTDYFEQFWWSASVPKKHFVIQYQHYVIIISGNYLNWDFMIIRNASRWLSCYIVLNLELCHPKKNITWFVTFYHSIHIYFGENCFLKIGTCQLSSYLTWKCTLFGFIISNLRSRDCM